MCLGTFRVNDDYSERFSFFYLLYTFFFLVVSIELINKIEREKKINKNAKKK